LAVFAFLPLPRLFSSLLANLIRVFTLTPPFSYEPFGHYRFSPLFPLFFRGANQTETLTHIGFPVCVAEKKPRLEFNTPPGR